MADITKSSHIAPETTGAQMASNNPSYTPEERKKRYAEFRKKLGRSRLEIKGGDPNKHYFFAPKEDDAELVRLDYLGYAIVKEPNAKDVLSGKARPKLECAGLREDGTYVIGDVILMCCDHEVYEFHMMDVDERSEAQISAAVEEFKTTAAQRGAPTFERG